jgi:hypothetical protein
MSRYLSIIKKTKSFFTNEKSTLLGRWNTSDNYSIKQTLANMDSCGDSLCGTPKKYKEAISQAINKK